MLFVLALPPPEPSSFRVADACDVAFYKAPPASAALPSFSARPQSSRRRSPLSAHVPPAEHTAPLYAPATKHRIKWPP